MTDVTPSEAGGFLRRYRLVKLVRFSVRNRPGRTTTGLISVIALKGNERVRLRFLFRDVEEYRFQRRPNQPLIRLKEVRLGHFQDLFFLNLDAYEDDNAPRVMDFRASDCYLAARGLGYLELPIPKSNSEP